MKPDFLGEKPHVALAIGMGSFGGAEYYLELLASQLAIAGFSTTVVGNFEAERLMGSDYVPIDVGPKWSRRTLIRSVFRARKERRLYLRELAELDPDVAHLQFKREQILLTRSTSRTSRVVWTEHGVFPGGVFGALIRLPYRRASKHVETIICVSHQVRHSLTHRVKVDPSKLVVIDNPVDLRSFKFTDRQRADAREQLGIEEEDVVVLTLSRLEHSKGIDRVIDAFKLLPAKFRLLIVGEGNDIEKLKTKASRESGSRVEFLGFRKDVHLPLSAGNIFILPSRAEAREGLPMSLLQALASNLPFVVTHDSGLAEFASTWGGVAVEPTPSSIAAALEEVAAEWDRHSINAGMAAVQFDMDLWRDRSADVFRKAEDRSI